MGYGLTVVNAISSIDSLRTLGSTWADGGGYFNFFFFQPHSMPPMRPAPCINITSPYPSAVTALLLTKATSME